MRKLILSAIIVLIAIISWLVAPAVMADYDRYQYHNQGHNYTHDSGYGSQFHPTHPDYYDGNLRLQLKTTSAIEQAAAPRVHYDKYAQDYYRCNWKYNTNLRSWVCEKNVAQPVLVCPFGYTQHPIQKHCTRIYPPAHASLNKKGDNWQCNTGYHLNSAGTGCDRDQIRYAVYNQPQPIIVQPVRYVASEPEVIIKTVYLPPTGAGISFLLLSSLAGAYGVLRLLKTSKQNHNSHH